MAGAGEKENQNQGRKGQRPSCLQNNRGWRREAAVGEEKKIKRGCLVCFWLGGGPTNGRGEQLVEPSGREEKKSELGAAAPPLEKIGLGHF